MSSYIQLGLTPVTLKIRGINSGRTKKARGSGVLFLKEIAQQIAPREYSIEAAV